MNAEVATIPAPGTGVVHSWPPIPAERIIQVLPFGSNPSGPIPRAYDFQRTLRAVAYVRDYLNRILSFPFGFPAGMEDPLPNLRKSGFTAFLPGPRLAMFACAIRLKGASC